MSLAPRRVLLMSHHFTLDSVVPRFPVTCFTRNERDLAICSPAGLYILTDFGLDASFSARFIQGDQEFRSISFYKTDLVCLSVDGKSIWRIDTLTETRKLVHGAPEEFKFTAIHIENESSLKIGSSTGHIITFNLLNNQIIDTFKVSQDYILIIADQSLSCDAQGRLFLQSKLLVDDGVLQPSRILLSAQKQVFFVKHRSIYRFPLSETNNIQIITLDSCIPGTFYSSEIIGEALILATDLGQLFQLKGNSQILEPLVPLNVEDGKEEEEESDKEESSNIESETEMNPNEHKQHKQLIIAILKSPNTSNVLLLTVDPTSKRAAIRQFPHIDAVPSNHLNIPRNDTCTVQCPLCEDEADQNLHINALTCLKGHPITICSNTLQRIDSIACFRCRQCSSAFAQPSKVCPFCSGFLASPNIK